MSKQSYRPRAVQQVPNVHLVQDPHARQALEVLVAGWRTRNGETEAEHRFATHAELRALRQEMLMAIEELRRQLKK